MKIAIFTPGLGIGGIERVFINYANMLSEDSYDVTYLVCNDTGILRSMISDQVRIGDLKCGQLRKAIVPLAKYLRRDKPDYILCANSSTLIVLLAKYISCSRVKIISSQHNHINVDTTPFAERVLVWKLYNYCYKVIAISDGIQELLLSKGVKESKIIRISNPIDFDGIQRLSKKPVERILIPDSQFILFAGRLSKVKNIDLLINAYYLSKAHLSYNLVIAGEGDEETHLRKCVSNFGLDNKVFFIGSVSNPYPLIKQSGLIALSSLSEAYPTILVEALFLGKNIISTPSPGALEILRHGELGFISADFSAEAYTTCMMQALDQPKEGNWIIAKAYELYHPKHVLTKLKSILE